MESDFKRALGTLAALAAIVAAIVGYLQYTQQKCESRLTNAQEAFWNQNWRFASGEFENYLRCEPTDEQALHMCIESHYQAKNFSRARYWISRGQEAFPSDPVPDYWKAVLLIVEDNDFENALPILERVHLQVEDLQPKANMFLGMAQIKEKETIEGCKNLKYYVESPLEKENEIRRAAAQLYRDACVGVLR